MQMQREGKWFPSLPKVLFPRILSIYCSFSSNRLADLGPSTIQGPVSDLLPTMR